MSSGLPATGPDGRLENAITRAVVVPPANTLHVPISLRVLWSPSPLHTYTGTPRPPHLTQALGMSWEP